MHFNFYLQKGLGSEIHNVEEQANTSTLQKSAIQEELEGIRIRLEEANRSLNFIQASNQTLTIENEQLKKELSNKTCDIVDLQKTLKNTQAKCEELNSNCESLVSLNDTLQKENSDLKCNISLANEKYEITENHNRELTIQNDELVNDVCQLKRKVSEQETNFPALLENSNRVKELKETILHLENEVFKMKKV